MPIHNLRRCSNNSYMYDMDMGCSLLESSMEGMYVKYPYLMPH
jgi:hypothetical protein